MGDKIRLWTEYPKINFIEDTEAEEDAFGSHTRIATAIASVIGNKRDLKVIGLLGHWGSGKSTVIKYVCKFLNQNKLEDRDKFYCFKYDAWLHQSDPHKRAFLESLIKFLIDEGLTTYDRWEKRLLELNRQIEDTEITSTPTLSKSGRWLLPSAFLVPVGMQFLGNDWYTATSKTGATFFELNAFPLGVVAVLAPLIVAAALFITWRPTLNPLSRKFYSPENWTKHKKEFSDESLISIFTNRQIEVGKNTTVRSPDPTTIEFQTTFREIMNEVSMNNRRFIFILDNLDRLPESQAIDMWATVRSFFLGSDHVTTLPTVILPIDEDAVERMYAAEHAEGKLATSLAKSFMDKTFDLTFYVTRPVLSEWQFYFRQKLASVFGEEMQKDWPYIASSIYDRWLLSDESNLQLTPRKLNTLINSLASIWLQWGGFGISFASIAYYAVHRKAVDENIRTIVETPNQLLNAYDPHWQTALAAMHYGVEPEYASQVLIERPLSKAIETNDSAEFHRLSKIPGFHLVFDQLLFHSEHGKVSFSSQNALILYDQVEPSTEIDLNQLWQRLTSAWIQSIGLGGFNENSAQAIEVIASHRPTSALQQFLNSTSKGISQVSVDDADDERVLASYVAAVRAIHTVAVNSNLETPKFTPPGTSSKVLPVAHALFEESEILKRFDIDKQSAVEVVKILADLFTHSQPEDIDKCFLAIQKIPIQWDFGPLVERSVSYINSDDKNSIESSARILERLHSIVPGAIAAIEALTASGRLTQLFHEFFLEEKLGVAAPIAALVISTSNPARLTLPNNVTWDSALDASKALVELIVSEMTIFDSAPRLMSLSIIVTNYPTIAPLAKAIASRYFRSGNLLLPSGGEALASLQTYMSCLDSDLSKTFIGKYSDDHLFWSELQQMDLNAAYPTFDVLCSTDSPVFEKASRIAIEMLSNAPSDVWKSAIHDGNQAFLLTKLVSNSTNPTQIRGQLFDSLRTSIPELTTTEKLDVRERWFELSNFLSTGEQKMLSKYIASHISAGNNANELLQLLSFRDDKILTEGEFWRNAEGTAMNIIVPFVGETEGLKWLVKNAAILKRVVEDCTIDTKEAIRTRLDSRSQENLGDEATLEVGALWESWGFNDVEIGDEVEASRAPQDQDPDA